MTIRSYLSMSPELGENIYLDPTSLIIGSVKLADEVSVWPFAVLRGDVNDITVGARSNIQDQSVLHVTHRSDFNPDGFGLHIGEDVTVGHRVTLHGCTVGNRVLVGMDSIVMDDTIIEDDVMLGAGSLVPGRQHLESGYLYLGRPAKKIRKLTDIEIERLKYSSEHYVRVKNNYLSMS